MSLVTLDIQKHIAFLTLNRPDALNSLNSEVFSALEAALEEIERAPQVRAVILTERGNGRVQRAEETAAIYRNIKEGP